MKEQRELWERLNQQELLMDFLRDRVAELEVKEAKEENEK